MERNGALGCVPLAGVRPAAFEGVVGGAGGGGTASRSSLCQAETHKAKVSVTPWEEKGSLASGMSSGPRWGGEGGGRGGAQTAGEEVSVRSDCNGPAPQTYLSDVVVVADTQTPEGAAALGHNLGAVLADLRGRPEGEGRERRAVLGNRARAFPCDPSLDAERQQRRPTGPAQEPKRLPEAVVPRRRAAEADSLRPALAQRSTRDAHAGDGGEHQRRRPGGVVPIHVRAARDQRQAHTLEAALRRQRQHAGPRGVGAVDVGAAVDEGEARGLELPDRRERQDRARERVRAVDSRARVDQLQTHSLQLRGHRHRQHRRAVRVPLVHVGAMPDQGQADGLQPCLGREGQNGGPAVRIIDVGLLDLLQTRLLVPLLDVLDEALAVGGREEAHPLRPALADACTWRHSQMASASCRCGTVRKTSVA